MLRSARVPCAVTRSSDEWDCLMKLGKFEIYPVTDGRFRLDGGAMFGVVPKVLWEQCCPADEKNRIHLGLNCLLIRAHGKNILVDTGLGSKVDARFQDRFAIERKPPLEDSLKRVGLAHEDVHMVVNTHLHFDHCGGNTMRDDDQVVSAFLKAKYFVQRGEYEDAVRANERTRASYLKENFKPVAHVSQWGFLDGHTQHRPGLAGGGRGGLQL